MLRGSVSRRWVVIGVMFASGCGFRSLPGDSDMSGVDLAGLDLTGIDFSTGNNDLAGFVSGPGPAGALPNGFCCTLNDQCRSRFCTQFSGGPSYCVERCDTGGTCDAWGEGFVCNAAKSCEPPSASYACLPAAQFLHGTRPNGACCAHGFPTAGQECEGGLCVSTGNDLNPFYCTQGCSISSPCPSNYTCAAGFCWVTQTFVDSSYIYTCQ